LGPIPVFVVFEIDSGDSGIRGNRGKRWARAVGGKHRPLARPSLIVIMGLVLVRRAEVMILAGGAMLGACLWMDRRTGGATAGCADLAPLRWAPLADV
jgi:hypothetical protein